MKNFWCRTFHTWYGRESQVFHNVMAKLYRPAYNFDYYCPKCDKIYWRIN